MRLSLTPLALAALIAAIGYDSAQAAFPTVALKPVVLKQIHSPTTIAYAPDGSGRLFVCDQPGKISIIEGGMLRPTPFLDLSSTGANRVFFHTGNPENYSERGLLGLAFHPGYGDPESPGHGKFYLNYSAPANTPTLNPSTPQDNVTVVAEYHVSAGNSNVADLTERIVLTFGQPQGNHNGGQLEFGTDGFLYIGTGDGGSSNDNSAGHTGGTATNPRPNGNLGNGQDRRNLLGKILRIDVFGTNGPGGQYGIPAANPFVGLVQDFTDPTLDGPMRGEIYAYGLRNPWRFSFDKRPGGTGRLFCGDVGQGQVEEIDIITMGGNYGWRYREGSFVFSQAQDGTGNPGMVTMGTAPATWTDPIAQYEHPGAGTGLPSLGLSVTGGFVYRGAAIPSLQGKYLFGDYGSTSGRLMGLEETFLNSNVFTLTDAIPLLGGNPISGQHILCLGEDESGEIYVGLKTNGGVMLLDNGFPAGGIYKIVAAQTGNASLPASQDNTIFSEDATAGTFTSDGRGYLFAGRTGPAYDAYNRRALIAFDLGSIPAGATVQTAQVKLNLNKTGPNASGTSLALHKLSQTWGEGTSANPLGQGYGAPATVGDATWTRRFYNTSSWTTAGGSFSTPASATIPMPGLTLATWGPNAQLAADVQSWLNTPSSNAGWILIGSEVTEGSACRFDSGEQGSLLPTLALTYLAAPPPTRFETWLATYFPSNHVGQWVDPNGDIDGDSIKNQIEYAYETDPLNFDADTGFSALMQPGAGGSTEFRATFRRDTAGTDLTFLLQTSSDLTSWTTIAQSIAGGAPFGLNGGVVESDLPFAGSVNTVTVRQTLPVGTGDKKFARLRVDRQ